MYGAVVCQKRIAKIKYKPIFLYHNSCLLSSETGDIAAGSSPAMRRIQKDQVPWKYTQFLTDNQAPMLSTRGPDLLLIISHLTASGRSGALNRNLVTLKGNLLVRQIICCSNIAEQIIVIAHRFFLFKNADIRIGLVEATDISKGKIQQ